MSVASAKILAMKMKGKQQAAADDATGTVLKRPSAKEPQTKEELRADLGPRKRARVGQAQIMKRPLARGAEDTVSGTRDRAKQYWLKKKRSFVIG